MRYLFLLASILLFNLSYGQFPPLELTADDVIYNGVGGTVDVNIRAGSNFSNITQLNGSFQVDPTILNWNQMSYWGLSNPAGATFTDQGGGNITFTWSSLITIGPTLNQGAVVFTLRFNVIGAPGSVSPVAFTNSSQSIFWGNGFGWSGTSFNSMDGSVTLNCVGPPADFTSVATGSSFCFTDTTSNINSWAWDFGDSNTSTLQNPCHVYSGPGNYVVCLTVTDSCSSTTFCDTVTVCTTPNSAWTSSTNNYTASFSDISTGPPTSWFWDFGDGNTSTLQNPTHTYTVAGTYTTCLTIANACGADSSCQSVIIACPLPGSAWSETSTELDVTFTDNSPSNPTSWFWNFGDGNIDVAQNPQHTYNAPGTYTVCLTSTNSCGTDSSCNSVTVTCAPPVVTWSDSTSYLTSFFTDGTNTNPTAWLWDFGDGNTSTQQNPMHTYAAAGNYTVCLTATSTCGTDSSCGTVTAIFNSISELDLTSIDLYPNPTTDLLTVELPNKQTVLSIYSAQGKLIASYTANGNTNIPTANLASGLYFMKIELEGEQTMKQFIKK